MTSRFCFPGQVPGPTSGPLITTLTVAFTQPAAQGTVTATFTSTATFFPGDAQHVEIVGGGDYTVHSVVDTTHAVLTNTGLTGNAAPASTVFAPASVVVVQAVSVVGQTGGGGSTVTQGPAAALSGAWPVEQTDGTNILGTASHPTRVDPTGTTPQPVTAAALPLPTGAATDANVTARLGTLGQKTSAGSAPVVIASDQPAIPIAGTAVVVGTVTANVGTTGGLALDATLTAGGTKAQQVDGAGNTLGTSTHPTRVDPTGTTAQPITAAALPLPTGAAQDSTLTARLGTLGQKTSAGSAPVVLASDQSPLPISGAADVVPATQNITTVDVASTTTVGFNNQGLVTGTPTVGSAATFSLASAELVRAMISGTWTGTLQAEGSIDGGVTWIALSCHVPTGTLQQSNTFTGNCVFESTVGGCTTFRLRATAAMTGTATVLVVESKNAAVTHTSNAQRLADAAGAATANVKAGSTAATLADAGLVVQSSPVPTGTWYSQLGVVSGVMKASAGNLRTVHGVNRSTTVSLLYLQFFNQTTGPSGSPAVFAEFPVPSLGQVELGTEFFGTNGVAFGTGIAWGWSTTTGTFTVYGTAADVSFQGVSF